MIRRRLLPVLGVLLLAQAVVSPRAPSAASAGDTEPPSRPNILLIVSDDQAWSTFNRDLMPATYAGLVDQGVLFDRAYDVTSECCPSRSEILTGLYEHNTGVATNGDPLTRPTIVQLLHGIGYRTMLSGKYLNSYECAAPLPEFDQFVCSNQQPYVNPTLNVNGDPVTFSGYTADIEAQFVADFVAQTPASQPFFALWAPYNPHLPADDPRCAGLPVDPYRPPSFDEDTAAGGKPAYLQRPPFSAREITSIDSVHRRMTQAVACLDPAVDTVLSSLGDRSADTMVVYLSDNGYLYGEHRWQGKVVPYEESVRVPFVVRYPRLVPVDDPAVSDALVENVDIAPTIADLVGMPWGADGHSILPLLTGQAERIREGALLENCQTGGRCTITFNGLVTDESSYVENGDGETELYDLTQDPYQLTNLAGRPEWAAAQAALAAMLQSERGPHPTETTIVTGPPPAVGGVPVSFTYFSQSRLATYRCRLTANGTAGDWFSCDGQAVTLGPLAPGDWTFEVAGTDENGVADATPAARSFSVVPAASVSAVDSAFSPRTVTDPQGGFVRWTNGGAVAHTATDAGNLGLFDSGSIPPGGTYAAAFPAAGTYAYACTLHPAMKGTVTVPVVASPPTGSTATTFQVVWSASAPPPHGSYQVQIQRPGQTTWSIHLAKTTATGGSFLPDAGPGPYAFRARPRLGTALGAFSPPTTISVGPARGGALSARPAE